MEQNFFKVASDDAVIKSNEKWFKFFVLLPVISTIISAVACFVLGIVFECLWGWEGIAIGIFWGGGAVFCVINYAVMRLLLSYQILHIYYLKKISNGATVANAVDSVEDDGLPMI
jgi:hypothetical protein